MAAKFTWAQVARMPPPPPTPSPSPPLEPEELEELVPATNPLEIPSSNPRRQLLGLPQEAISMIFRAIFLKQDGNIKLECSWRPDGLLHTKSLSVGPKGLVSMLCTNKKARDEGLRILYSENTFECYHARVFKNEFIRNPYSGIGIDNAARIRKVQFGLPLVIIRALQEDPDHTSFLDLLCSDLPGLRRLPLKTQTAVHLPSTVVNGGDGGANHRRQSSRVRALIATAARATKYHPQLRMVIYRKASGGRIHNDLLISDFYVDATVAGFGAVEKGSVIKQDAYGNDYDSTDIVLDSRLIRQTPWRQTARWASVKSFKLLPVKDDVTGLDKAILSSEVDSAEITTWPGYDYDPLLELKHADQVALVQANRGRYIRNRFVPGNFVNGSFVRGDWSDTGFLQGKQIPDRMVDGTCVEGQFVQGNWITDEEFIEGNWVNGTFIQGMWVGERFVQGRWSGGLFTQGRWEGEVFTEGRFTGDIFYAGTWRGRNFLRGAWSQQPAIPELKRIS